MEKKFKKFHHLTYNDRLKIEQMRNGGAGVQEIADALRVNYTTVYRELKRPGVTYEHLNSDYTTEVRYSADKAQAQYEYGKTAKGKMLRRLFPKGTNFDDVPDKEIIAAADWMNNYPRKVLGRTTAARVFAEHLAQLSA